MKAIKSQLNLMKTQSITSVCSSDARTSRTRNTKKKNRMLKSPFNENHCSLKRIILCIIHHHYVSSFLIQFHSFMFQRVKFSSTEKTIALPDVPNVALTISISHKIIFKHVTLGFTSMIHWGCSHRPKKLNPKKSY